MAAAKPITANDVRKLATRVDRWATEAEEAGNIELSEHLYNAHDALNGARGTIRRTTRNGSADNASA